MSHICAPGGLTYLGNAGDAGCSRLVAYRRLGDLARRHQVKAEHLMLLASTPSDVWTLTSRAATRERALGAVCVAYACLAQLPPLAQLGCARTVPCRSPVSVSPSGRSPQHGLTMSCQCTGARADGMRTQASEARLHGAHTGQPEKWKTRFARVSVRLIDFLVQNWPPNAISRFSPGSNLSPTFFCASRHPSSLQPTTSLTLYAVAGWHRLMIDSIAS